MQDGEVGGEETMTPRRAAVVSIKAQLAQQQRTHIAALQQQQSSSSLSSARLLTSGKNNSDESSKAIVVADTVRMGPPRFAPPVPQKVVREEDFVKRLDHIIRRDFFPDLLQEEPEQQPRLGINNDDDDGRDDNGRDDDRVFHEERDDDGDGGRINAKRTFRDFGDHDHRGDIDDHDHDDDDDDARSISALSSVSQVATKGLDAFLANHVSEDTESFKKIVDARRERQYVARRVMVQDRIRSENVNRDLLPGPQPAQLLLESSEHWRFLGKNSLMFNPEGNSTPAVENARLDDKLRNAAESKGLRISREKEILYHNTRFPPPAPRPPSQLQLQAQSDRDRHLLRSPSQSSEGSVFTTTQSTAGTELTDHSHTHAPGGLASAAAAAAGATGRGNAHAGPRVLDYVASPVPTMGPNESPIMTWGEIGATPVRLAPSSAGPFTVRQNKRDLASSALLEQMSASKRARKPDGKKPGLSTPAAALMAKMTPQHGRSISSELRKAYANTPQVRHPAGSTTPAYTPRISTQEPATPKLNLKGLL